ncbi:MAG: hypothetical protein ACJ8D4_02505 [Xanthobacteraceae bacterium]
MPSDPDECRANALRCARLAEEVTDNKLKTTLAQTARGWINLAMQLERAQALRDELRKG